MLQCLKKNEIFFHKFRTNRFAMQKAIIGFSNLRFKFQLKRYFANLAGCHESLTNLS